ncbi:hypothetical protein EW146_g8602, partial [Bondarzewia mesenterica]
SAGRGSRAAKTQANLKLDAQAKELAELQRQAAAESKRGGKRAAGAAATLSPRKAAVVGTRVSARLRGATVVEDEWQEIPEEWLKDTKDGESGGKEDNQGGQDEQMRAEKTGETHKLKTGLEEDDAISELTELSEETGSLEQAEPLEMQVAAKRKTASGTKKAAKSKARGKARGVIKEEIALPPPTEGPDEKMVAVEESEPEWRPPDDFVEWETLCVTLYDWEHIAARFEKATNYREKVLYKTLTEYLVPPITAELREIEHKRRLEEAVTHRKRSSRLAMKESEKEESRLAAVKKAEEEEKQSRARRLEARRKREEEEREKREDAREKRRREREEREERKNQRRKFGEESSAVSTPIDVVGIEPTRKSAPATNSAKTSGSRTPAGEDWELDCEICHKRGINLDDGVPLLCCGKCSKWQHIACHDYADRVAGRPKRNWDVEEFVCQQCRMASAYPGPSSGMSRQNGTTLPGYGISAGRSSYPAYQPSIAGQPAYNYGQTIPFVAKDSRYDQGVGRSQGAGSRPYQPQTAFTFTHYQPQQRGFSTAHASASPQAYAPASAYSTASNGYNPSAPQKPVPDHLNGLADRSLTPSPFVHRPYIPNVSNGNHWSTTAVQQPLSKTLSGLGSLSTNGYNHYNSSAERSSVVGAAYEHGAPDGNANAGLHSWQRAQPSSSYLGPPVGRVSA